MTLSSSRASSEHAPDAERQPAPDSYAAIQAAPWPAWRCPGPKDLPHGAVRTRHQSDPLPSRSEPETDSECRVGRAPGLSWRDRAGASQPWWNLRADAQAQLCGWGRGRRPGLPSRLCCHEASLSFRVDPSGHFVPRYCLAITVMPHPVSAPPG